MARVPSTWDLIASRGVVRRATIMALIVGHVLALINHGDKILTGQMATGDWLKVSLTFLVPYTVSTISSLLALREQDRKIAQLTQRDLTTATIVPLESIREERSANNR